MAELVYTVQAIEHYMEISIDNLLQTISERNLIQGIGHYSRNFHRFLVAKNIWNYFVKVIYIARKVYLKLFKA